MVEVNFKSTLYFLKTDKNKTITNISTNIILLLDIIHLLVFI
jgi:hypothetical protein